MPVKCSICNNKEIEKLNVALVNETPMREVEKFFGVSRSALSRHKRWCLPAMVAAALQAPPSQDGEEPQEPSTVQGRAEEMSNHSRLAILHALKRKDYKTAFAGMREHRGYIEVIGKTTGETQPMFGPREVGSLFIMPAGSHVAITVAQANLRATLTSAEKEFLESTPIDQPEMRNITPNPVEESEEGGSDD